MRSQANPLDAPNAIAAVGTGRGIALIGPGGSVVVPRAIVAALVDFLIAAIDIAEPDPDDELTGDESDTNNAEDELLTALAAEFNSGPGCDIGDPDSAVDDRACDPEAEY